MSRERMAITGMSGAGKSTVARTLAGLSRLGVMFLEKKRCTIPPSVASIYVTMVLCLKTLPHR